MKMVVSRDRSQAVRNILFSLAITLLVIAPLVAVASAPSTVASSPLSDWTRIQLAGRKYLIARGEAEISRWRGRSETLVRVESSARVFGRQQAQHVAFSLRRDRHATQWMEQTEGKRARAAWFDREHGYLVARYRPDPSKLPWPWLLDYSREWPAGPLADQQRALPIDGFGLLGQLDHLVEAQEGELTVLSKHGFGLIRFETRGTSTARQNLYDLDRRKKESVELNLVEIWLIPTQTEESETVLGLRDATQLMVDRDSGALVSISGSSSKAGGRLQLRLKAYSRQGTEVPRPSWPARPAKGDA